MTTEQPCPLSLEQRTFIEAIAASPHADATTLEFASVAEARAAACWIRDNTPAMVGHRGTVVRVLPPPRLATDALQDRLEHLQARQALEIEQVATNLEAGATYFQACAARLRGGAATSDLVHLGSVIASTPTLARLDGDLATIKQRALHIADLAAAVNLGTPGAAQRHPDYLDDEALADTQRRYRQARNAKRNGEAGGYAAMIAAHYAGGNLYLTDHWRAVSEQHQKTEDGTVAVLPLTASGHPA